jgi:methionine sulfoxide reductase heme-binding subunit
MAQFGGQRPVGADGGDPSLIAATSPLIWYTTRASGVVALVLLTASVCLGILTTTRLATPRLPRFAVSELHARFSLIAMVFVMLHVVTAVVDTYVSIGLTAAVLPFTSGYRPLPVALGTVAFDLLLAVTATSMLRRYLKPRLWRGVHWLVYASWPIAFVHGIWIGTDLKFGWMQIVSGLCAAAVVGALVWRFWANPYRGGLRTAGPQGTDADPLPVEPERPVWTSPSRRQIENPDSGGDARVVARYSELHRR